MCPVQKTTLDERLNFQFRIKIEENHEYVVLLGQFINKWYLSENLNF